MTRFDYVLFDFDGTIADSQEGILNCAEYAFERMGLPVPSREELRCFCGPSLVETFMLRYGMSEADAFRATDFYRERYQSLGWQEAQIYPGVAQLLHALRRAGAYVAIASSKPQIFLERICVRYGLLGCFDRIVGIREEGKSSDKRENVKKSLPGGVDPARVCMIGDRRYDIEAGKSFGFTAIGAVYGYGTREELASAGADLLADSPRELTELLLPGEKPPRGRFISFEGADGCGKSTQLERAAAYLRDAGWELVVSREPGGCPVSEAVRGLLLDNAYKGMSAECEALLFAAARAEHVKDVIRPAVEAGKIVLCDRYIDSSLAYQACARELGYDFIRQINKVALEMLPDRTLLFTGEREKVSQRLRAGGELDRIEREKDDFVKKVYEGYRRAVKDAPERVREIDSDRSIEAIFEDVKQELNAVTGEV